MAPQPLAGPRPDPPVYFAELGDAESGRRGSDRGRHAAGLPALRAADRRRAALPTASPAGDRTRSLHRSRTPGELTTDANGEFYRGLGREDLLS